MIILLTSRLYTFLRYKHLPNTNQSSFDYRKSFKPLHRREKAMAQIFPKDYVSFLRNISKNSCNLLESQNFVKSKYYNIDMDLNDSNYSNPPYLNHTNMDSPFELLMQNAGTAIISLTFLFIVGFILNMFFCSNLEEEIPRPVDWRQKMDDLDFRISNTDTNWNIRKRCNSESDLEVDANEEERQKKIGCFCHNKISLEE